MRGQKREARLGANDPRIHHFEKRFFREDGWVAGSSPATTVLGMITLTPHETAPEAFNSRIAASS
jgi:hypothetical protein